MNRRKIAGPALVVGGTGIGVLLTALFGGGDDTVAPPVPQTTTTVVAPDAVRYPEAAELFELVTSSAKATVHATYRVMVSGQPNRNSFIEVWQKDGRARQDATAEGGTSAGRLSLLDLEDRVVMCQEPPGGKFTCTLVADSQRTAFDNLRESLLAALATQDVKVRDDTIDGRQVRCFTVTEPAASELCTLADGVLVRITAAMGSFELLDLDREVDDAVFTPPATPGAG